MIPFAIHGSDVRSMRMLRTRLTTLRFLQCAEQNCHDLHFPPSLLFLPCCSMRVQTTPVS